MRDPLSRFAPSPSKGDNALWPGEAGSTAFAGVACSAAVGLWRRLNTRAGYLARERCEAALSRFAPSPWKGDNALWPGEAGSTAFAGVACSAALGLWRRLKSRVGHLARERCEPALSRFAPFPWKGGNALWPGEAGFTAFAGVACSAAVGLWRESGCGGIEHV